MSKEFPLYPELSEKGKQEAQDLIDGVKKKLSKLMEDVLGEIYVDVVSHIESDSWGNFRNHIMDGFKDYNTRFKQGEYDFKEIRKKIYEDFHDDIIKDLNQDLVNENAQLKKDYESLKELYYNALKRY